MNKNIYLPAIWGGLFIFLTTTVPGINLLNCMCGAGVIGGGVFAVYMHRRSIGPNKKINAKAGITLGLLCGLVGAVLSFMVLVIVLRFFNAVSYDFTLNSSGAGWSDWFTFLDPYFISKFALLITFTVILVFNVVLAALGSFIGISLFGQGIEEKNREVRGKRSAEKDSDGIVVEKGSHY